GPPPPARAAGSPRGRRVPPAPGAGSTSGNRRARRPGANRPPDRRGSGGLPQHCPSWGRTCVLTDPAGSEALAHVLSGVLGGLLGVVPGLLRTATGVIHPLTGVVHQTAAAGRPLLGLGHGDVRRHALAVPVLEGGAHLVTL